MTHPAWCACTCPTVRAWDLSEAHPSGSRPIGNGGLVGRHPDERQRETWTRRETWTGTKRGTWRCRKRRARRGCARKVIDATSDLAHSSASRYYSKKSWKMDWFQSV